MSAIHKKNMAPKMCPCGSERRYTECCGSYHKRQKEAPDAEALMRSRYSAFVLKDIDYLWHTLHSGHEDRQRGREAFAASVKANQLRYMGLVIYDRRLIGDIQEAAVKPSQVLFLAKVFYQGRNVSFIELSDFYHDGAGFRYKSGMTAGLYDREPPQELRIDTFFRMTL